MDCRFIEVFWKILYCIIIYADFWWISSNSRFLWWPFCLKLMQKSLRDDYFFILGDCTYRPADWLSINYYDFNIESQLSYGCFSTIRVVILHIRVFFLVSHILCFYWGAFIGYYCWSIRHSSYISHEGNEAMIAKAIPAPFPSFAWKSVWGSSFHIHLWHGLSINNRMARQSVR